MSRRIGRPVAAYLALLLTLPGLISASGGDPGEDPGVGPRLWLRAGAFDPLASPLAVPEVLRLPDGDTQGVFIVQFDGPITEGRRSVLEEMGEVLGYIPDYALVLRTTGHSLRELRGLPGVRWAGVYEPGYKLSPNMDRSAAPRLRSVSPFPGADTRELSKKIETLGAVVWFADPLLLRVEASYELAVRIAFLPEVEWVEDYNPPSPTNYNAAQIIRARTTPDGAYDWGTSSLWRYNPGTGKFEGYAGAGFVAAVADTGVDGTHPAFDGKKVAYYAYGYSNWVDYYGHGTHTAGSVLGNGAYRPGQTGTVGRYAGMAPLAGLVGQLAFSPQTSYYYLCRDATASGAVVSSNSWGGGSWGSYDSSCESYDYLVRDSDLSLPGNQSISVFFSAGNEGDYGAGTVDPPSTAKNVVSVGATDNSNGNSVAGFSSRGPCDDGRIKPDIVAPGAGVTSCSADSRYSYVSMSGTSMSCPIAAGAAVVVNEYYCITRGSRPSPAMVKNLLINGADPMSGRSYPDGGQGWGRLNLARSLLNQTSRRIWTEDQLHPISTGLGRTYAFNITGAGELKVSLVWTDVPGTPGASRALVNDLDLVVIAPNGTVYFGNSFESSYSRPNGTADRVNNVEVVRIASPAQGGWLAGVRGYNVPQGPQDYSLVIAGPIGNASVVPVDAAASRISVAPEDPAEGDFVSFSAEVSNVGLLPLSGVAWRFLLTGPDNDTSELASGEVESLGPGAAASVSAGWSALRGNYTISLEVDPLMTLCENTRDNNIAITPFFVRGYGVELHCEAPELRADPGGRASFELEVLSTGNAPDTISLSLEGGLPEGWSASLSSESVNLGAGERTSVKVDIEVSRDAPAFERVSMRASAVSGGNLTHRAMLWLTVEVNQVFMMELFAAGEERWVEPGGTEVHRLEVRNAGNGPDEPLLALRGLPDGWGATLSTERLRLAAGEAQNFSVIVSAPRGARALSQASITVSCSYGRNGTTETVVTTRVRQLAAIELELAASNNAINPGGEGELTVIVRNRGNGPDAIALSAELPEGWRGEWSRPVTLIEPGDYATERLTVFVPQDAPAGQMELMIGAVSGADPNVTAELEASVLVKQYYGVRLSAPVNKETVEPGSAADFEVVVENTGNGEDTFILEADESALPGWSLTIKPSRIVLGAGQNATMRVRARSPANESEGSYALVVTAVSWNSPSSLATQKLRIELVKAPAEPAPPIVQPPPPAVEEPEPPAESPTVRWLSKNWPLLLIIAIALLALAVAFAGARRRAGLDGGLDEEGMLYEPPYELAGPGVESEGAGREGTGGGSTGATGTPPAMETVFLDVEEDGRGGIPERGGEGRAEDGAWRVAPHEGRAPVGQSGAMEEHLGEEPEAVRRSEDNIGREGARADSPKRDVEREIDEILARLGGGLK
ncbi:MAG: S8 family serine peptidase [Thermoplasmata archaeon]